MEPFNTEVRHKSCLSTCGHQACYKCLWKILGTSKKVTAKCPMCKKLFSDQNIIKLYWLKASFFNKSIKTFFILTNKTESAITGAAVSRVAINRSFLKTGFKVTCDFFFWSVSVAYSTFLTVWTIKSIIRSRFYQFKTVPYKQQLQQKPECSCLILISSIYVSLIFRSFKIFILRYFYLNIWTTGIL
jgi:hypothetical protein